MCPLERNKKEETRDNYPRGNDEIKTGKSLSHTRRTFSLKSYENAKWLRMILYLCAAIDF